MAHASKRLEQAYADIDRGKEYSIKEAVELVKDNATANFDETIELVMNLNVDPRQADQTVRGMTSLPNGTGKDVAVAVFTAGPKAEEAKNAGADYVGTDELAKMIEDGDIPFDRLIATPDQMGKLGPLGRYLGPRGLMPNPKLGTVTEDVTKAVEDAKGGAVEFRAEKNGIVHAGVGKASFSVDDLLENIRYFTDSINRAKPSGVSGRYIKSVSLSSTMGPGVKVDLQDLVSNLPGV
jgi:large subunit ribosomal protein L1